MRSSQGDVAACWDNAVVERFLEALSMIGYLNGPMEIAGNETRRAGLSSLLQFNAITHGK